MDTSAMELILYVLLLIAVIYAYQLYVYTFRDNIPSVFPLPLLGNFNHAWFSTMRDDLTKLMDTYGEHGILRFNLGPIQSLVLVWRPDLVDAVLRAPQTAHKNYNYFIFDRWFGPKNIVSSNGDLQTQLRKLYIAYFREPFLEQVQANVNHMTHVLIDKWTNARGDVRIDRDVDMWAFDIICDTAVGFSPGALARDDDSYTNASDHLSRLTFARMASISLFYARYDCIYFRTRDGREYTKWLRVIDTFAMAAVKKWRASRQRERMCVLSGNIDACPSVSDDELASAIKAYIFAGMSTNSVAFAFLLYEIARKPHVQQKVYDEIMRVCPDEGVVTLEHTQQMSYMDMVVLESLRLHPSISAIERYASEDLYIGEYFIPKHTSISLPMFYGNVSKYYDNPREFIPERFASDPKPPLFSYSMGRRACMGRKQATMVLKIALTKMLKHYELLPADVPAPIETLGVGLGTLNGIHVRLRKRN